MSLKERLRAALDTEPELTKDESIALGNRLKEEHSYEGVFSWMPDEKKDDPVALLKSQGKSRVQALLPLRYERMSPSAFTFYRGGALIMASDMSKKNFTGLNVQACGDAHISNFGMFSSPERRTVFDINDFDETSRAPWELDIARLAASVEICGRDNGLAKKERKNAVKACAAGYREGMIEFASMGNLDVWYAHLDIDDLLTRLEETPDGVASAVSKTAAKAKGKDSTRAVSKLTEIQDDKLRIISDPPLIVPMRDLVLKTKINDERFDKTGLEKLMTNVLVAYKKSLSPEKSALIDRYSPVDMAHKVVGVGSVGTRAWIIVMEGADKTDPLVLQVKEAQSSVLEGFFGKSTFSNHGQRVVIGQRLMQTASDMLLGWCRVPDADGKPKDYYVRQLWDGKGSINLATLTPDQLAKLARACQLPGIEIPGL